MRKKFQRIPSIAAKWSSRLGWLALLSLVLAAIGHRFGVLTTYTFFLIIGFTGFLAVVAFMLAIKGLGDLWQRGDKAGSKSIKGMILSFVTLLPIIAAISAYFILPPLYDVASDIETPPQFISNNRPSDALLIHNSLYYQANEQLNAWPQLTGRRFDGSPDKIMSAVLRVMDDLNWKVVQQVGTVGEDNIFYLEGVVKTPVLGFVSDIVVRLSDEGDTTFVDMRAASRYLAHDLGINARLILSFMDALDSKVLLTSSDQSDE